MSMSRYGAQIRYAQCVAPTAYRSNHVPDEVVALARSGKRKDAIVKYRELTGADPTYGARVVDGLRSS